jgi:hypothetical protein
MSNGVSPADLARRACSIAEDVRAVYPGGGIGSLATAIEVLAAAILAADEKGNAE